MVDHRPAVGLRSARRPFEPLNELTIVRIGVSFRKRRYGVSRSGELLVQESLNGTKQAYTFRSKDLCVDQPGCLTKSEDAKSKSRFREVIAWFSLGMSQQLRDNFRVSNLNR